MSAYVRQRRRSGVLMLSSAAPGLYLFVLPYATKWRSGRRTGG